MPPRTRRKAKSARVWVKVPLTGAELDKLRRLAAADLRGVGAFVTWLVAHDLDRPAKARLRRGTVHLTGDRRALRSLLLTMPAEMRPRLESAAQAEMRSISGFVGRVVVEALARKERARRDQ